MKPFVSRRQSRFVTAAGESSSIRCRSRGSIRNGGPAPRNVASKRNWPQSRPNVTDARSMHCCRTWANRERRAVTAIGSTSIRACSLDHAPSSASTGSMFNGSSSNSRGGLSGMTLSVCTGLRCACAMRISSSTRRQHDDGASRRRLLTARVFDPDLQVNAAFIRDDRRRADHAAAMKVFPRLVQPAV